MKKMYIDDAVNLNLIILFAFDVIF